MLQTITLHDSFMKIIFGKTYEKEIKKLLNYVLLTIFIEIMQTLAKYKLLGTCLSDSLYNLNLKLNFTF